MCETGSAPYLAVLLADALLAAAAASPALWLICNLAQVSTRTVTSHAIGLPRARGSSVMPSCCSKLIGSSLTAGIWAHLVALQRMSFM